MDPREIGELVGGMMGPLVGLLAFNVADRYFPGVVVERASGSLLGMIEFLAVCGLIGIACLKAGRRLGSWAEHRTR